MLKNRILQFLLNNAPLILFLLIFIIFGALSNRFLQIDSLTNIVKQASYIGIMAVGMTFVLLTAGIDLSVGSNMYLSAIVAGLVITHFGAPVWLALLVCLAVGFIFGSINAFLITKAKIIPFIVTLATMVAGRGLGLLLTKSRAISFPDAVVQIGSTMALGIPLPIAIFALVVFIAWIILNKVPMGRQIYAVGNDMVAAKKAGIKTDKVVASTYIVCGVLAALGGFISVSQLGIVNAGFGKGDEFDAIAAAVLGGTSLFGGVGSVFPGTVLGALLIQMVWSGLVFTQVNLYLQPLVFAGILFIAVLLDSVKNRLIAKMRRRRIRVEE